MSIAPLTLSPPPTARARLTAEVKRLAAAHGLTVARVTSAAAFPEWVGFLERHVAAGRMAGLDWFTAERARFSCSAAPACGSSIGASFFAGRLVLPSRSPVGPGRRPTMPSCRGGGAAQAGDVS
jgi:hypothetical protein